MAYAIKQDDHMINIYLATRPRQQVQATLRFANCRAVERYRAEISQCRESHSQTGPAGNLMVELYAQARISFYSGYSRKYSYKQSNFRIQPNLKCLKYLFRARINRLLI